MSVPALLLLSADAHTDDYMQMAECYSYKAAQSMCTISQSNMPALKYVQIARCTICFVTGSSLFDNLKRDLSGHFLLSSYSHAP